MTLESMIQKIRQDSLFFCLVIMGLIVIISACTNKQNTDSTSENSITIDTKLENNGDAKVNAIERTMQTSVITYDTKISTPLKNIHFVIDSLGIPGDNNFKQRVKLHGDIDQKTWSYQDSTASPLCLISKSLTTHDVIDINGDFDDDILVYYIKGCDGEDPSNLYLIIFEGITVLKVVGDIPVYFETENEEAEYLRSYLPKIRTIKGQKNIADNILFKLWKNEAYEFLIYEGTITN